MTEHDGPRVPYTSGDREQRQGEVGPQRAGRLGIGVIGAGRVGPVLASALRSTGHAVVGVAARSAAGRERAATMLAGVPVLEVSEVVRRAELVLLAVPDDALSPLVEELAEAGAWQAGQLVVHTAGSHGWRVLEPAVRLGAIPLAVHPAMTFTGTSLDLVRLREACCAVTAPSVALPIGLALVVEMGAEPIVIAEESRPLYHAALAHGANHLITVVAQALDVLRLAGVTEPARLLGPLAAASLDNALRRGDDALTGPVARGDAGTVAAHLRVLSTGSVGERIPDVGAAYRALARVTADRALAHGRLSPQAGETLLGVLGD